MLNFAYRFEFPDSSNESLVYSFSLDEKTVTFVPPAGVEDSEPSEWAKLDFYQCPHCPLTKETHLYCPCAKNLNNVAHFFKDTRSVLPSRVVVMTPERFYVKKCSVQEGISSLFGLVMATSGCPHLDFLKPMARFHLPFATLDESLLRITSFYLLERHIKGKQLTFDQLALNYQILETLNNAFINRLRSFGKGDAEKNALIILNSFAQVLNWEFDSNFESLKYIFDCK